MNSFFERYAGTTAGQLSCFDRGLVTGSLPDICHAQAQDLADAVAPKALHLNLDGLARRYCPPWASFRSQYHWSLSQGEYSTDVVFKRRADFAPLYEGITCTAIHAVKPESVATFLGRKLRADFGGELGSDFSTRIEGTRIKHPIYYALPRSRILFALWRSLERRNS